MTNFELFHYWERLIRFQIHIFLCLIRFCRFNTFFSQVKFLIYRRLLPSLTISAESKIVSSNAYVCVHIRGPAKRRRKDTSTRREKSINLAYSRGYSVNVIRVLDNSFDGLSLNLIRKSRSLLMKTFHAYTCRAIRKKHQN